MLSTTLQTTATTNPEPYCAELYNARELPYSFFSFDLPQLFGEGFPVFFDINLSADDVANFYDYVAEGLYYDSNTRYAYHCPRLGSVNVHQGEETLILQGCMYMCVHTFCLTSSKSCIKLYVRFALIFTSQCGNVAFRSCITCRSPVQAVASSICDVQSRAADLLLLCHQL